MSKDILKAQAAARKEQSQLEPSQLEQSTTFSRRQFFRLAGLGVSGYFLSKVVEPLNVYAQSNVPLFNKARNCIFIHLDGGPSHIDTFDLKEGSWTPKDFQPTTIGSLRWPKGLMPNLADQLSKIAIVRSISAWALVHPLAQLWTQIGRNPATGLAKVAPNIGAVVALEYENRRTAAQKLPGFIALNASNLQGAGYFPPQYEPFSVIPTSTGLLNATHPEGQDRFQGRIDLLNNFDGDLRKGAVLGDGPDVMSASYDQAVGLMYNEQIQSIFQITASDATRYGNNGFGNSCIVARNLIQADQGSRFIHISLDGWDNHSSIYDQRQGIYGPARALDAGLSQLIVDLEATPGKNGGSLLDETLIVTMGEFGRTVGPITNQQGRDHFLQMSVLFAGAGVQGGRAIGSTDTSGAQTMDPGWVRGVTIRPEDVFCTIYSALGIDYTTVRTDDPFKRGFEYVPFAKDGIYAPIDVLW